MADGRKTGDLFDRAAVEELGAWAKWANAQVSEAAERSEDVRRLLVAYYVPVAMDVFNWEDVSSDNPVGAKDNLIAHYEAQVREESRAFDGFLAKMFGEAYRFEAWSGSR